MKSGKSYTIDDEVINRIEKEAKGRSVSASWLVNEFLKEKLEDVKNKNKN